MPHPRSRPHRHTLPALVAEIQRRHSAGESLSPLFLRETGHEDLLEAAVRLAGTWSRALGLAGLRGGSTHARWSREVVVRELRRLHAQGQPISTKALRRTKHTSLVSAALYHFGTFAAALRAAAIAPRQHRWSKEEILAALARLARSGHSQSVHAVVAAGNASLVHAAIRHFGSWARAKAAADLPDLRLRWTRARVLTTLRDLARPGATLRTTALRDAGHSGLVAATLALYGTFGAACRAAGLDYQRRERRWSRQRVVDELRRLDQRGGVPTLQALARTGRGDLAGAIQAYFRRLTIACVAAGVDLWRRSQVTWTASVVLSEIHGLWARGVPLAYAHVPSGLYQAAGRLFGTWHRALAIAAAPIPAGRVRRAAPQDIVERRRPPPRSARRMATS